MVLHKQNKRHIVPYQKRRNVIATKKGTKNNREWKTVLKNKNKN